MIAKYMTYYKTTKFVQDLQKIVNVYNNTPNEGILKFTPKSVVDEEEKRKIIRRLNLEKMRFNNSLKKKNEKKFKIGDNVRVKIKKNLFAKGYEITYSKEIYSITDITNEIATLNTGKKENLDNLVLVFENENYENTEKDEVEKEHKVGRKLKALDASSENIITEKRVRKKRYWIKPRHSSLILGSNIVSWGTRGIIWSYI
jgi:hypothetical protein